MNHQELFDLLGPAWHGLSNYYVKGEIHWLGCEVVELLGFSSTTQAIKGTPAKPKLKFPAYRMEMIPEVNEERSVYLLTLNGIIQVIKSNRNNYTKQLQRVLADAGL